MMTMRDMTMTPYPDAPLPSTTKARPAPGWPYLLTQKEFEKYLARCFGVLLHSAMSQSIKCKFGTIAITGPNTFDYNDGFTMFGPVFVRDTQELATSEIPKILNRSDWTEEQINEAVKELNRDPEQESRDYHADLRLSAALEREDA